MPHVPETSIPLLEAAWRCLLLAEEMPEETQVLELLYSSEAIASPPPHVSPGELFDACLNYAEAVLGGPVTVSYHPDHSTPYIRMTRREDAV